MQDLGATGKMCRDKGRNNNISSGILLGVDVIVSIVAIQEPPKTPSPQKPQRGCLAWREKVNVVMSALEGTTFL
jgi:hypothetical protein